MKKIKDMLKEATAIAVSTVVGRVVATKVRKIVRNILK